MNTITNDDIFERLNKYYSSMRLLMARGAVLDGNRPMDKEYTQTYQEAMDYYRNLPENQKGVAGSMLGLIARLYKKAEQFYVR